jgi:hypothetical protein
VLLPPLLRSTTQSYQTMALPTTAVLSAFSCRSSSGCLTKLLSSIAKARGLYSPWRRLLQASMVLRWPCSKVHPGVRVRPQEQYCNEPAGQGRQRCIEGRPTLVLVSAALQCGQQLLSRPRWEDLHRRDRSLETQNQHFRRGRCHREWSGDASTVR